MATSIGSRDGPQQRYSLDVRGHRWGSNLRSQANEKCKCHASFVGRRYHHPFHALCPICAAEAPHCKAAFTCTMTWPSIEALISDLELESQPDDLDGLRDELRSRLAQRHPDKSNGSFGSDEEKEAFHKLGDARDFIDARIKGSQALIPIDRLPAIIEAIQKAQIAPIESRVAALRSEARSDAKAELHSRLMFPRISSGVFAAISGFAATFGDSFESDPVLGDVVSSPYFRVMMLVIALYAGIYFMMTWISERREEMRIERASSESGRREIFMQLIRRLAKTPEPVILTLGDMVEEVRDFCGTRLSLSLPIRTSVGPAAAEKIAKAHILELEDRGVIEREESVGLDVRYRVSESVVRELLPDTTR